MSGVFEKLHRSHQSSCDIRNGERVVRDAIHSLCRTVFSSALFFFFAATNAQGLRSSEQTFSK